MTAGTRDILAFDLDGTLVDFKTSELACLARILKELGAVGPGHEAALRRAIHDGWRDIGPDGGRAWSRWRSFVGPVLLAAGVAPTDAALAMVGEGYRSGCLEGLRLFPEVADVLRSVAGARLILMTNGPAWMQRAKLDRVGIREIFSDVFISEEVGAAKPQPAFFEAVKLAGYDRERVVVFGDDPVLDVAGAQSSGMAGVWVNRSGRVLARDCAIPDAEGADLMAALSAARERGLFA